MGNSVGTREVLHGSRSEMTTKHLEFSVLGHLFPGRIATAIDRQALAG